MAVSAGTKLGPYEVLSPIGAGGMGAVYEARDTRLQRTVAIKVLREVSPALRERFDREARVVAALQHPHICTLYDIGSHDGTDFLVMEHLEGQTLRCPQPLDKALEYAIEIAEALDAAHCQGVIHRDLKPANIMITRSGVKVLDFGLARRSGDETLTVAGEVLGTPAYMTPEQWQGRKTDARTDIHALGLVIYEMVTGKRATTEREKLEPARLERAVRRCLETDPEERWQSARDLKWELESIREAPLAEVPAHRRRRWLWPAATVALAAASALAAWLIRPAAPRSHFQVSVNPPPKTVFLGGQTDEGGIALSPDGTMLAFSARSEGRTELWLRRLDSIEARPLPGSEGAYYPFWSPDSRWVGFFSQNKLKKVEASGGPAQTICDAQTGRGGAWNYEGVIVFSAYSTGRAIHRVAATGGVPAAVTRLDRAGRDNTHLWPQFLPDGKRFLYLNRSNHPDNTGIWLASLDDSEKPRKVLAVASNPGYAVPERRWWSSGNGHMLFVREGTLMAQAFDAKRLAPVGDAFPVAESVTYQGRGLHKAEYSISANGMLVYRSATGMTMQRLLFRDLDGKEIGSLGAGPEVYAPRLSPDGKRVAFSRRDGSNTEIWIAELERNTPTRFTFDPGYDSYPVWSPDGASIAFSSAAAGPLNLYRKSSSGAGNPERLTNSPLTQYVVDWSGDGRFLMYVEVGQDTGFDLTVLPMSAGEKPFVFLRTKFQETQGSFSPGTPRWVAYASDESGALEVYVQAFTPGQPATGARWQVSSGGGREPRWRDDGKELYYLSLDGKVMAVSVKTDVAGFQYSAPKVLFSLFTLERGFVYGTYHVTRDGRRFLFVEPAAEAESQPLTLVTDWLAAAKR
jgi:Tol biopolymer transport system component/predicted Ser/Thr protein kinase